MTGVFDSSGYYDSSQPALTVAVSTDLAAAYSIAVLVGAALVGDYSIAGQVGTVGADFTGSYSVAALVSADLVGGFAVAQLVATDLAGSYAIAADDGGIPVIPSTYQFQAKTHRVRLYTGRQENFSPKRAAEVEIFGVDFADELAPGEVINLAAWSVTVVTGVDPAANAMIYGATQLIGTVAAQRIAGGVPGVQYAPVCTAQTSFGQTLVLPEYGHGQLYIAG